MQRRKVRKMNKAIYKQHDSRWASLPYPTKSSRFGGHGCGCCACTHVAIEQEAKKSWTPKVLRPWMVKQGYAVAGHGTTWNGITETLKHIGHKRVVWVKKNESLSKAWKELDKGNRIGVILFNSNKAPNGIRWTSSGHYVAFTSYKKNKNGDHLFYCKDSGGRNHDGWYSYERSMRGCIHQMWIVERVGTQVKPKAPYKITKPYTGGLPAKTVRKGSRGIEVKHLQEFLNWAIGAGLAKDGYAGKHTISALKRWQKAQKIKVDGIFANQSRAAAKKLIAKYAPMK